MKMNTNDILHVQIAEAFVNKVHIVSGGCTANTYIGCRNYCNKVTSKCNRVTSKEQSELIKNEALYAICRHFLLTAFIEFEYSRPPVWPKDAAQSQQKKGIVR